MYTFNCRYKGYPAPSRDHIGWTYNGIDVQLDDRRFRVHYGEMYTSLVIDHATERHVGRYGCRVGNYIGDYDLKEGSIIAVKPTPTWTQRGLRYIIAAGLFSSVLLMGGFAYAGRRYLNRKVSLQSIQEKDGSPTRTVYISHCTQGETNQKNLLKFACLLEHNIPQLVSVLDLTRQVEINESGGAAQWIPKQMAEASKILVILSKRYMEAIDQILKEPCGIDDRQASKARTEYRYLEKYLLHEDSDVCGDKLIILRENVKIGDLPVLFKGRNTYPFPRTQKDFEQSTLMNLFCFQDVADVSAVKFI